MNRYIENVLGSFLPRHSRVNLQEYTRTTPDFILVDMDQDGMPEMILSVDVNGRTCIGVLKRAKIGWQLERVEEDILEMGIAGLVEKRAAQELSIEKIGQHFTLEDIFGLQDVRFIAIVEDQPYYGEIKAVVRQGNTMDQEVIDFKYVDVTGDGRPEYIYLMGDRCYGDSSNYVDHMNLVIKDAENKNITGIPLDAIRGYRPVLFVGDFTGNQANDIMITIFSKNTLDTMQVYVYSLINGKIELVFSTDDFLEDTQGSVVFKDGYKVEVVSVVPAQTYTLDISYKDADYLDKLYDVEGKLIGAVEGKIEDVVTVIPLDYDNKQVYHLLMIQPIVGVESGDILGTVETVVKWDSKTEMFQPVMQYVAIYGREAI